MLSVAYSIAHKLNSHKGMTLATRNDKIVKVHKLKIIMYQYDSTNKNYNPVSVHSTPHN